MLLEPGHRQALNIWLNINLATIYVTLGLPRSVEVTASEGQSNVNLHARGQKIESIYMNDLSLDWGNNEPRLNTLSEGWKQNKVKDFAVDLAWLSFLQYKCFRKCHKNPKLCIKLPIVVSALSSKEITLKVRLSLCPALLCSKQIEYSVECPTGFRFVDGFGFTSTDCFEGVSTWMPCN